MSAGAAACSATARAAVSDCAELLVLMNDADRRVSSFEGEFYDWAATTPSNVLVVDRDDVAAGRLRLGSRGPGLYPQRRRGRRRIWFESPQRLRVELLEAGAVVRVGVRDGTRWWRWDRQGGTSQGRHDPAGHETLPALLDPALLSPARMLTALRFEGIGEGIRLERRVLLARAVPRDPARGDQVVLQFEFDAEYGTMLRRAVFTHGRCVQLTEALEARFGIAVDPQRFVFAAV